jgi:hypothetical protein
MADISSETMNNVANAMNSGYNGGDGWDGGDGWNNSGGDSLVDRLRAHYKLVLGALGALVAALAWWWWRRGRGRKTAAPADAADAAKEAFAAPAPPPAVAPAPPAVAPAPRKKRARRAPAAAARGSSEEAPPKERFALMTPAIDATLSRDLLRKRAPHAAAE